MASNSILIACLVAVVMLLRGLEGSALNDCHIQCRDEEELKRLCKLERNCQQYLPDWGSFLDCLAPCSDIGNNCFQRCAFKTDDIHAACIRQCRLNDAAYDVNGAAGPLTPAEVSSNGVNTAKLDNRPKTLCYKDCYDTRLNDAMNRLYRKRP